MRRILIALEDYNERLFCETLLKKLGFDTQSFQTDSAIFQGILSFNPDLILMTANGKKVNGVTYLPKLKTKYSSLPVVFVGPRNKLNVSDRQIVALLEPPISPRLLIELLANIFDLDDQGLIIKYEKTSEYKKAKKEAALHVTGDEIEVNLNSFKEKNGLNSQQKAERQSRYASLAASQPLPTFVGMNRTLIQEQVREFRAEESDESIGKIDQERRMFALELARRFRDGKR